MLIMKMNPLRVEWFSLFKGKKHRKEAAVSESGETAVQYGDDQQAELFDEGHQGDIASDGFHKLAVEAELKTPKHFQWLERWWCQGNMLCTLAEFEEDTKWIHILSARYIPFL